MISWRISIQSIFLATSITGIVTPRIIFSSEKNRNTSIATNGNSACSLLSTYKKDCVFCRIAAHQEPAVILYEDDLVMAFEKIPPRNPVNCLIIPKTHIENLKKINTNNPCEERILTRMIEAAQKLSHKLNGPGDFKIVINSGKKVGQTVFHLHMHFETQEQWLSNR